VADQLRGGPCRLRTGHLLGTASARCTGSTCSRCRRTATTAANRFHRRVNAAPTGDLGVGRQVLTGRQILDQDCTVFLTFAQK
jgi:hypothetical protein